MLKFYETGPAPGSKSVSLLSSVAVHVALLLALYQVRAAVPRPVNYSVTQVYAPKPHPAETAPLRRVKARRLPTSPALMAPRPAALLARLPAQQPAIANLAAPPELAVTRAPLPVRQPVLPTQAPVAPAPPAPVFASALPAAASAPPSAAPRTGYFASVPTAAPVVAAKLQASAGAFGDVPVPVPAPSHSTNAAIVSTGFGAAGVVASNPRRAPYAGPSNAFGGVGAAAPAQVPSPLTRPAPTVFGAAIAADPAHHPAAPPKAAAEALEILYKPRPVYTEEARRARVEGDVVLEVLFLGSGSLRVLRVVRGLGFGLEQNALEAAAKVRFRPASENGRPVDTVATIRISFQMAY